MALLLDKKADINLTDKAGNTPLMGAAGSGLKNIMIQLAEAGSATDTRNEFTQTALMLAVSAGHVDVVEWLLANGADPYRKNQLGQDCFKLAEALASEPMLTVLEKHRR